MLKLTYGKNYTAPIPVPTVGWEMGVEVDSVPDTRSFDISSGTGIDVDVDWGDGSLVETFTTAGTKAHEFASTGTYTIKLSGGFSGNDGKLVVGELKPISTGVIPYMGISSFAYVFAYCPSLTSIPSGLFDNNTSVTSFSTAFLGCTSITEIPDGLFDNNTSVTDFGGTFALTDITSIPTGLFDNNIWATDFSSCFYGTSITGVPTDLFKNCYDAETFEGCFYDCSDLTTIPSKLFNNLLQAKYFGSCFNSCTSLGAIPTDLFDDSSGGIDTLDRCFYNCHSVTSSVPELWVYQHGALHTDCFYNCTSATNYGDIPYDWK